MDLNNMSQIRTTISTTEEKKHTVEQGIIKLKNKGKIPYKTSFSSFIIDSAIEKIEKEQ